MPAIRARGFAVLVAVLAAALLPSVAAAAPLLGSNFDSNDGDQVPAGVAPAIVRDWQDVATAPRLTTNLDTQATDDCFIGGVKEDSPKDWAFNVSAGGCTPGKSDLLGMWSNSELTPTASILHAAFVRQDPNGNTFITFELNRSAVTWVNAAGATIPCRSNGDLLLAYDIGGSTISVTIYRWTGDGTGPVACPNGANGTFASSTATNNGMINSAATPIANYLSPGVIGATIATDRFGEAQIDVASVLGAMGVTGCFSYIQAQAHTRSSSSISSALIDNVKPVATRVANCSVAGSVFADSNADGVRGAAELPIAGRTVYLDLDSDGTFDPGEPTATTDAGGDYQIVTTFTSGTYPVRLVVGVGNVCTTPVTCAFNATFTAGGANSVNNVFGLYVPAAVSGAAYEDANGNGTRDAGENTPIAGRTVFADADDDNVLDPGESSTTTAADGTYTVGGLPPGTTRIRFVNGGGWVCNAPAGCLHAVAVSGGQVITGRDFLAFQAPSVSGTVYDDADADAVRDGAENGAVGVIVGLYAADGTTLLATTTTGPSGGYSFSSANVPAFVPGSYVVRVTPPPGRLCSAPCATPVTLGSGQSLTSVDTGVFANATVSGTAYTDSNNNAARDGGEPPAPGVVIYADLDDDGVHDPAEPAATTDPAGNYTIANLRPGALHIRALLPPATACSTPAGCDHALAATSGETLSNRDFGLVQAASASGRVAIDDDADATADAGEPPLGGWRVYADLDGNGQVDAGEPFAITAGDGTYLVANITPGTRTIRVDAPAGWTCSSPCSRSVALSSGANTPDLDFALYQPAQIAGVVYEDGDGDGIRDAGDDGLDGRTVFIDLDDDGVLDGGEPTATTTAGGAYAFTGLAPGTYRVVAEGEPDWVCSDCSSTHTLTSGQQVSDDFGRWLGGSISGTVYVDANGNGGFDAEPPLAGRLVYLDRDDDGDHDPSEPSTLTGPGGTYALDAVTPGSGTLRAALPAGFVRSEPVAGGYPLTITSGAEFGGRDFGGYEPGSITGHVANDLNGNGVDDPGEPGKAGWTVYLDSDDDGEHDPGEPTATTDASGDYTFGSLVPATYRVRPVITAGFTCTKPALCVYVNALVSGEDATARDFALVEAARVSGVVYADDDADGTQDGGEPGRGGRTVYVDYDGDGEQDPGEPGATSDGSGAYTILGVSPGSFTVRYAAPAGERVSQPAAGSYTVSFGSGDAVTGRDFGSYLLASISGDVYDDADASGDRQAGEDGLAGRTVSLDVGADGSIEDTTTTDGLGAYTFSGLTPGSHRVTVTVPGGWDCTTPSPCRIDRTLTSGESSGSSDFGLYRIPVADLSLAKSAPATVNQGETFDYTLEVSNAGPDAAQYVSVADALPSGVEFQSASAGCAYDAPDVGCDLDTIAAGGSATVTITVRAVDAGAIANSASVSSETGDPSEENNDDDAEVTVTPVADVQIAKTGSASVAAGDLASYTLTATNNGPSAATGVVLRDTLPAGLTFDAGASDAGWSQVAPGVFELTIGTLADGASASRQIVARAGYGAADSDVTNVGTVRSSSVDTTPGNDTDSRITAVGPSANLAMNKSVDDSSIAQGENATFTLQVSNGGPSAASDVSVSDPLPSGMRFVSLSAPAGFNCTTPAVGATGTISCSGATLASGATATFTLVVEGVATGTQTNTANVGSSTPDPSGANDSDTATVQIAAAADVSLTKDGPEGVDAGANATYTLTATNNGPSTAHGVVIADTLPAGMTFVSLSAPAGTNCTTPAAGAGGTVTCTTATLADGASVVVTLVARAPFALADTDVANTATVGADEVDPDPTNDTDSVSTGVGPASDLRLQKSASVPALTQGQTLTYTLSVTNDGPSDATNVTISDPLPAGVSFVSASDGCTESTGTVTCDLGSVADGATAGATITVTATANGTQVNTATVASDNPDPDPSDNPASATVEVGPTADLSIAKTASESVAAGGTLAYTLGVSNSGPSNAANVTVSDELPAGMTHVSSSASQGTCALAAGTVNCALGSLANGATATVTITVQATFAVAGTSVPNSATVSSPTNDDDPADNASTHVVNVGPAADLVFTKDAPASVPAGGTLLYSLQVANNGPQAATGAVITDTLPAGLTFVSAVPTQGTCAAAGQVVTCAIGELANGAGAQVLLTVTAAASLGGQSIHNTASAASDTPESAPASNTDDATTAVDALPVDPPEQHEAVPPPPAQLGSLSVTKTADTDAPVALGRSVAFTIRVSNDTDRTAHGVVAIDQPAQGAKVDSVRPQKGTCSGLTCRLGDLAPREVVLIHVAMTPTKAGPFENAVVVQSDDGERDAADNRGVAAVRVKSMRTTLRLTKTVNKSRVRAGQSVWFTITAKNTGREAAANVRVCDSPAHNTTFLVARSAKLSKGRACWAAGTLPAGRSVTYKVKARISGNARTKVTTMAVVTSSNASSRQARRSVRVVARAVSAVAGVTG